MKKQALFCCYLVVAVSWVSSHQVDFPKLKGPYLGQKPPGLTPEIFAPGVISKGYFERSVVFSPRYDELFFELRCLGFTTVLMHMKQHNGEWSDPETAAFSGIPEYCDCYAFFTYDGRTLFFSSRRPLSNSEETKKDSDIWMLRKNKGKWGMPIHAGNSINSTFDDYCPALSKSNNLYFCSNRDGNYDIYVSHFSEKGFSEPRRLDFTINTKNFEGHPFIAADESYLIFSSDRPGERGQGDLYISFKGKENEWLEPINMGDQINSPFHEAAPYVSPDGKYLFFCSFRPNPPAYGKHRLTYLEIKKLLDGPGNGRGDIYWISSEFVERLRPGKQKATQYAQQEDIPKPTGPYLGQKPPGLRPEVFASGIVSREGDQGRLFIAPDGSGIIFF
jgi:hypothetical protein